MVEFHGRLWVLAGKGWVGTWNVLSDVWSSADGIEWRQETASAPWGERLWPIVFSHEDRLWLIGGKASGVGDVWTSSDGVEWRREAEDVPQLRQHTGLDVASFRGKLWICGTRNDEGVLRRDVYCSEDGREWSALTENAPWEGRYGHTLTTFDKRLWLIGGMGAGYDKPALGDVWSSADGKAWQMETPSADWRGRYGHRTVVLDGRLWVLGRFMGFDDRFGNDMIDEVGVWSSADGRDWTPHPAGTELGFIDSRYAVLDGSIWGMAMTHDRNDLWWLKLGPPRARANDWTLWR